MNPTQTVIKGIVSILTIQLAFLPVSFALKIQLQNESIIRDYTDSSMERVGTLKRGTIVEIPDEFTVLKNGKPDLEQTLNNWLRVGGKRKSTDGEAPGLYSFEGEKNDYFFPVSIKEVAKGSSVRASHQNTQHFIALKFLARNGSAMIISDDVAVGEVKAPAAPAAPAKPAPRPKVDVNSQMEAGTCAEGICVKPSDTSKSVRDLISAVSPALAAADKKSKQVFKRTRGELEGIYKTFEKSCGFPLSEFTPIVKARAKEAGVPAETLMAMMSHESSGRCHILNSETDNTQSIGLFQINSASSKFPRCTSEQKNILRNLGKASRLATGPRCLENPVINLQESIRILKDMKKIVTSGSNAFDESKLSSADLWRLTLSAYNGGGRWVKQAKADLEAFNEKNGTHLNAYNWEDLRLFYMRSWLSRNERANLLGSTNEGRRRDYSVANLAYAENIIGRDATVSARPGLSAAWLETVKE